MLIVNNNADHGTALDPADAEMLSNDSAEIVERFLEFREGHKATPLVLLSDLSQKLNVESIFVKDEGQRLGLGSFKALGGSYAVTRLVLEEASRALGRIVDVSELHAPEVKAVAHELTFACATDGNHGRSVAQGAQLVGAACAIFVHTGVSARRVAAIAKFGAKIIRVDGNYDDSVAEATRVSLEKGWQIVSDTSWPGYERIPRFVMQGYTALLAEAVRQMPEKPTHVFVQSGVGGIAAAAAGYFALLYGDDRPFFTVVDPSRAACIVESARAGMAVKIRHGEPTVMAMLECYEPSMVAWRILSRSADAFMTVEEDEAIGAMRLLANPVKADPAIVSGESGGVGLAALVKVCGKSDYRSKLKLGAGSRVLLINTEGSTDPVLYEELVGATPEQVAARSIEIGEKP